VGLLACLVVFCTLSALTLPAVTSENTEYQLENGLLSELPAQPEGEVPADTEDEEPEEADNDASPEETPDDASQPESNDGEPPAEALPEPSDEKPAPSDDSNGEPASRPDAATETPEGTTPDGAPSVEGTEKAPEKAETPLRPDETGEGKKAAEGEEEKKGEQPERLMGAGLRSGTLYSSELEDFVTGVVIHDADGNLVPPDGTVYLGESYDITISFSENNIAGQEKQFQYDADGYLTYRIPSFFVCTPVTNGELLDPLGNVVGSYTIDSSGLMRVQFIPGYINSTNTSMSITLNATANSSLSSGTQSIDFGHYTIDVVVSREGRLNVQKTAGSYDPRTHSIDYVVEVKARYGTVNNIAYTDTPSSGLTIDASTIAYTTLDGTPLPSCPTSLDPGEGFLVHYTASLDPIVYQNKNHVSYTARNTALVTGTNDEGPISAQDTASQHISTYFLRKRGSDDPANSRIHWTVTVGDGSTIVDGLTLTDLPGSGLTFDTVSGITATPWYYGPDGEPQAGTAFNIPFGADPTQITLPTGMNAYGYTLTYFTGYTLPPGVPSQEFSNTVSASDPIHGPVSVTQTAVGHETGVPPTSVKTVQKNAEGTALHYAVEIEVPGYYGGTAGFYLADSYTKITHIGTEYFFGWGSTNLSVYTVNGSDETQVYAPYAGGSTDYTFLYAQDDRNPRTFYFGFNVATVNAALSNWIEMEDVTLHIEYDLPLDAPVYLRPDGVNYVLSDTLTVGDLVAGEFRINNRARLYYNGALQYVDADATFREINDTPLEKTGRVNAAGNIEYTVSFFNRDASNETVLKRNMKSIVFQDELLSSAMSYVDGSLFCDVYNDTLTRIRMTYRYDPSIPISASPSLNASAADFHWYSGDATSYTTLYELAQHSDLVGNPSYSSARLVFRYQVAVDKNDPVFDTNALTVPLSNQARLTGIMPDDSPFDTGPADCTVDYDTDIVTKEVEHTEGSNRADFTITLNPAGVDLVESAAQMTIVDTMSLNLQPILRTIKVYYQTAGVWEEATPTPPYTYDDVLNKLTFTLPDDVPIRITYTTLITETGTGVAVGNNIQLEGFAEYSSVIDTEFTVNDSGGAAHSDNFKFTLRKQSADHLAPLSGAVFALYGPPHSERQGTPPAGTPASLTVDGQTLLYYTSYTTGADGMVDIETNEHGVPLFSIQGLYALKEITAPVGYELLADPICFYADEKPTGGLPDVPVLLSDSPLVVSDAPVVYLLPNTGGPGAAPFLLSGAVLLSAGMMIYLRRLRRKKR